MEGEESDSGQGRGGEGRGGVVEGEGGSRCADAKRE